MEYYGNNDWRNYLHRQNELAHFGIPKRSGRYPWGSGEDPYHHGASAPGGYKKKKQKELRAESTNYKPGDNKKLINDYSNTLRRGEKLSKAVLNDPNKKLTKEEVWDLEDYADQLFYNNTNGPSESWTSKKDEAEYYKLRKIIDKYN